jgi:hypothetical protein
MHSNVLGTYEAGRTGDGRDYLVRDFVEETDLAAMPRSRGPLPAAPVADVVVQRACGLEAAHATGAVLGRVDPTGPVLTEAEFGARLGTATEQAVVLANPAAGTDLSPLAAVTGAPVVGPAASPALRRRRMPVMARARRLTGAGSVVSAIVVVVAGAVVFGADGQDQAPSGVTSAYVRPGHPVPTSARPSSPALPRASSTRRPSRDQPTPRATVVPTTRLVSDSRLTPDSAAQLRSLADLLRADRRAVRNQGVQSAATLLEQAAADITDGSTAAAADLVHAAFGQLADAERTGSWRPSGPESVLLGSLGYQSPTTTHTHRGHD